MDEIIKETISKVDREFNKRKNELAYLALTSKVERPVQDKWAFLLHRELQPKYLVAREWKRLDIAILNKETPKALIELSAVYTFDVFSKSKRIIQKLEKDEEKSKKLFPKCKNIYTVLLMTHPYSRFPKALTSLKYRKGVNASYNKGKMRENSEPTEAKDKMVEKLKQKVKGRIITDGKLEAGEAFGIKTSIFYWIIKAKI